MSLIAWYPLNGDLEDYSGNEIHGDGATSNTVIDNLGKIGKCYAFPDATSGINIPNKTFAGLYDFTMMAWINPAGNHIHYDGTIISSGDWNSAHWSFGINQNNTAFSTRNPYAVVPYTFALNTWHHVTWKRKGIFTYVYVNGNYIGMVNSGASPLTSNAINTMIGRETYAGGYFKFNGKMNDVRIYDEALSDKEIKEIAKAKILHYKFDEFEEPTVNLFPDIAGQISKYNISQYVGKQDNISGAYTYPTAVHGAYTISADITLYPDDGATNPRLYLRFNYSDASNDSFSNFAVVNDGMPRRISVTGTSNAAKTLTSISGWVLDYTTPGVRHADAFNIHLEMKDHATPFINGSRGGVVKDASGYRRDAVLGLATTPKHVADSIVGEGAYYFAADVLRNIICPSIYLPTDSITISTRFKSTIAGWSSFHIPINIKLGTSDLTMEMSISSSGFIRTGMYISGIRIIHDTGTGLLNGGWHMVTMTYDKTTFKAYVDGILTGTWTDIGTLPVGDASLNIGQCNGYGNKDAYQDDVQIYAIALSDADVLELYRTKASLDNAGNLFVSQIDEPQNFFIPELFEKYIEGGVPYGYSTMLGRSVWMAYPSQYYPAFALNGLFKPNTQYECYLCLYHNTIHTDVYRSGGIAIIYTDGTYTDVVRTGGTGKFEEVYAISTLGKSIKAIGIHYYTDMPIYIDVNSYIKEYKATSGITEKSTLETYEVSELGPTNGLIAYYPLNGNAFDYTLNNNDGVVTGAVISPGLKELSYTFDGIDDYIDTNARFDFLATGSFSISLWINIQDHTDRPGAAAGIIGKGHYYDNTWDIWLYNDHRVVFECNGGPAMLGGRTLTSAAITINTWNHIVVTYNAGLVKMYVNNIYAGQVTYVTTNGDFTRPVNTLIGKRSGDTARNLRGKLNEVRIYDRALTIEELTILYDITKPNGPNMQIADNTVYLSGEVKEVV